MENAVLNNEALEIAKQQQIAIANAKSALDGRAIKQSEHEKNARKMYKACIADTAPVNLQHIKLAYGDNVLAFTCMVLDRAEKTGGITISKDVENQTISTRINTDAIVNKFLHS